MFFHRQSAVSEVTYIEQQYFAFPQFWYTGSKPQSHSTNYRSNTGQRKLHKRVSDWMFESCKLWSTHPSVSCGPFCYTYSLSDSVALWNIEVYGPHRMALLIMNNTDFPACILEIENASFLILGYSLRFPGYTCSLADIYTSKYFLANFINWSTINKWTHELI